MAAPKRRRDALRRQPRNASDRSKPITDQVLLRLREDRGMLTRIAEGLGIKPQAVHQWRKVPIDRVMDVERITGIDHTKLRPDFFHRGKAAYSKKRSNSRGVRL
jgi:hypothetical protein